MVRLAKRYSIAQKQVALVFLTLFLLIILITGKRGNNNWSDSIFYDELISLCLINAALILFYKKLLTINNIPLDRRFISRWLLSAIRVHSWKLRQSTMDSPFKPIWSNKRLTIIWNGPLTLFWSTGDCTSSRRSVYPSGISRYATTARRRLILQDCLLQCRQPSEQLLV